MFLGDIIIIEKDVDKHAHEESVFEPHQFVSGCKMNSLIKHPYHEALGNMGVPTGLVLRKNRDLQHSMRGLGSELITLDMIQHGGASVPNLIDDSMFDKLFDAVSYKKKRVLTRKIKMKK